MPESQASLSSTGTNQTGPAKISKTEGTLEPSCPEGDVGSGAGQRLQTSDRQDPTE
ncbi:Hypothetical predicted protein, partial [Marmota monax]